jgi:hypothetical protein
LSEAVSAGRNSEAIKFLVSDIKVISMDLCLSGIKDTGLPSEARSQFCRLLNVLFIATIDMDLSPDRMIFVFESIPSVASGVAEVPIKGEKLGQIVPMNSAPSFSTSDNETASKYPQFSSLLQYISEFLEATSQKKASGLHH